MPRQAEKSQEYQNLRKARRVLPWVRTRETISNRILRSKKLDKYGNKYRCYVGIMNYLTTTDLKYLWLRDAMGLKKPSINRIDSKGDYILENCQYIEMSENRKRVVCTGWRGNPANRCKTRNWRGQYATEHASSD